MTIDQRLLEWMACPQCLSRVGVVEGGTALVCERCKLTFPVQHDIPVMMTGEALRRGRGADLERGIGQRAIFRIERGAGSGTTFFLEQGMCKAVGRGEAETQRTTMFRLDLALSLDEGTRNLIMGYIGRQFRRSTAAQAGEGGERFGSFQRAADVVINDASLSRLHAMIFFDLGGGVGVLDLVSKNGTFVNGREIESRLLEKGDVIEIGATRIVFEGSQGGTA